MADKSLGAQGIGVLRQDFTEYGIVEGDTPKAVAKRYQTTVAEISKTNPGKVHTDPKTGRSYFIKWDTLKISNECTPHVGHCIKIHRGIESKPQGPKK